MCALQSPMSTGIVQYIRKSFFGPKTWGGALTNFYWRGAGGGGATDPLLPMLRRLWSLSLPSMTKKRKEPQCCLRPASEHMKGGENNNNNNKQSKTYYSRTPLTATDSQRRAINNGHFILSRTITPCSFCHVNILIQNKLWVCFTSIYYL